MYLISVVLLLAILPAASVILNAVLATHGVSIMGPSSRCGTIFLPRHLQLAPLIPSARSDQIKHKRTRSVRRGAPNGV